MGAFLHIVNFPFTYIVYLILPSQQIASFIILSLIPVALMESAETEESERIKRSGFGLLGGALQVSTI